MVRWEDERVKAIRALTEPDPKPPFSEVEFNQAAKAFGISVEEVGVTLAKLSAATPTARQAMRNLGMFYMIRAVKDIPYRVKPYVIKPSWAVLVMPWMALETWGHPFHGWLLRHHFDDFAAYWAACEEHNKAVIADG